MRSSRAAPISIEFGVPFSDPLADGPTVQAPARRRSMHGITLADCLQLVRDFRARGGTIPILLMGYTNPFYQYGLDRLAADAAEAGVDGFLIPDLPSDESDEFQIPFAARMGCDLIQFLAPTSTERRIADVAARATGFIYCVAADRCHRRPLEHCRTNCRRTSPGSASQNRFAADDRLRHLDTGACPRCRRAGRWRGCGERVDQSSRYTSAEEHSRPGARCVRADELADATHRRRRQV